MSESPERRAARIAQNTHDMFSCAYGAHEWVRHTSLGAFYFKRCVRSCKGVYQTSYTEYMALPVGDDADG